MLELLFGLAVLAALCATFADGAGDPGDPSGTVVDPNSSAGSGSEDDGVDDALAAAFAEVDGDEDAGDGEGEGGEEPGGEDAGEEDREKFIPRPRFDEVNTRMTVAEQRVAALEPFAPILDRLTAAGATPEQAAAYVLQQLEQGGAGNADTAAEPDPDAAFAQFLQDRNIDPYEEHSPATIEALRIAFEHHQALQGFQQQAQQAQQQAWLAERRTELQSVQSQHPEYQDPDLARGLVAEWEASPEGTTLAQVAERQMATFERLHRNRLAQQALTKPPGATRPVTAGGGTPSPAQVPDFTKMTEAQREEYAEAEIAALLAAGD